MNKARAQSNKALGSVGVVTRLAGGYLMLIAMILLVAAIGITNIGKIRASYDQVLDERIPRITELQRIQELLSALNVSARDAMLSTDAQKTTTVIATIESGRAQAGEQLEALQKALQAEGTPQSLAVATQVGNDASAVLIGLVKFSRYIKADKREPALKTLQESIQPPLQQLASHISGYQQLQISSLAAVKEEASRKEASVLRQMLMLVAASLAIACGFSYWTVRSVVTPLRAATLVARHMATGDLSHTLQAQRQDEVGQVIGAFNQISRGLSELVTGIRGSADQMHVVAEDIASRTERMETGSTQQNGALNRAMDFIDGAQKVIHESADVAVQAASMASKMETVAQRSNQSVLEAVHEMEMVKQSSHKITDIISLIDGIAFQTNILALNAAVEAARAGDQGRGFAVVAAEVRSLAGRSAVASKEIKGLILASQERVSSGTQKVQSIADIMGEVSQTVADMKLLVEQISDGSVVQSQHMGEMVVSVAELLAGNDSNVHNLSGLRQALMELRDLAHSLTVKVSEFKTDAAAQVKAY
jgi:methyl-accepting chemotaxis protein